MVELLWELGRLGVRLEANGERLRYFPQAVVTPDLLARLKAHKAGLLALLRPVVRPAGPTTPAAGTSPIGPTSAHTGHHVAAEADGEPLPDWANASGWAELGGGGVLARRNHPEAATLDWDTLDEAAEPCRACGSLAFWEDHDGRRHCGRCEPGPLDAARRLAERAAALRRRNPPRPKAKIPRGGGLTGGPRNVIIPT